MSAPATLPPASGHRLRVPRVRWALALAAGLRVVRRPVLELAEVPPARLLGGRAVPCHLCGSKLRPGQHRAVTRDERGRWRCGTLVGGHPAGARVPRGGRTLAWLLAQSTGGGMAEVR